MPHKYIRSSIVEILARICGSRCAAAGAQDQEHGGSRGRGARVVSVVPCVSPHWLATPSPCLSRDRDQAANPHPMLPRPLGPLKTATSHHPPLPLPSFTLPPHALRRHRIAQNSQFHRPNEPQSRGLSTLFPSTAASWRFVPPPASYLFLGPWLPFIALLPRLPLPPSQLPSIGPSCSNLFTIENGPSVSSDPRMLHISVRRHVALRRRMLVSIAPTRATSRPLCRRLLLRTQRRS